MNYDLGGLCERGKPIAMAMLLDTAGRHGTLTYLEIAQRLGKELHTHVSPLHIGLFVGSMMNRVIEVAPTAPPINTLVVNKTTKVPGDGADWYIKRYLPRLVYDNLSNKQKRVVLQPVHDAIYAFEGWEAVAQDAFGDQLPKLGPKLRDGESDGKAKRLGFGGPAESEEHRYLKEFVATNPKKFGAPPGCCRGELEKRIESWDEIDVWFMTPDEQLAVEVKSRLSNELDIQHGLFQCVKYRSVLEAQMALLNVEPKIRVKLVSEQELHTKHKKWARQLGIELQIIKALRLPAAKG